jgi:Phospholipase A1
LTRIFRTLSSTGNENKKIQRIGALRNRVVAVFNPAAPHYGELFVLRKVGENSFALMLRNNLQPGRNRGAVQLDWSFPLGKKFKGYVQYFNG